MAVRPRLTIHLKSAGKPYHAGDYEIDPDQLERLVTDWSSYHTTGQPTHGDYVAYKIEIWAPMGERHPLMLEFSELAMVG